MNVVETIEKRKSVRTYLPTDLSEQTIMKLSVIASELKGPFDIPFRFVFFQTNSKQTQESDAVKLGTYGVIQGAKHYFAGIVERDAFDLEQLGYVMEHLLLHATSMNLGTCWLGGTFSKKTLAMQLTIKPNELMPAISPIGFKAKNESLLSKSMKWGAKSATRKAWSELFYCDRALNPLNKWENGAYDLVLEMVRIAPSASNKQPWRIIKDGKCFHFFMQENKITTKAMGFQLQRVDMGIAMCHFELSAKQLGLNGKWTVSPTELIASENNNWQYIITWKY